MTLSIEFDKYKHRVHRYYHKGKKTKYAVHSDGRIIDTTTNTEVPTKKFINTEYDCVYLSDKKAKFSDTEFVHRIIAKAFIPNPKKKAMVNHKDGCKYNNHVTNLEWVTEKENAQHAIRLGLRQCMIGENNFNAAYSDDQVHHVCRLLAEGKLPQKTIAKLTGVSKAMVSMINIGSVRTDISSQYDLHPIKFEERYGENHCAATISEATAREICERLQNHEGAASIARALGIKRYIVNNIKYGKNWTHISRNYKLR